MVVGGGSERRRVSEKKRGGQEHETQPGVQSLMPKFRGTVEWCHYGIKTYEKLVHAGVQGSFGVEGKRGKRKRGCAVDVGAELMVQYKKN